MMISSCSPEKKTISNPSRHIIKLPEQQQQQKLSYQTNKLAQFIQLQLSDLENTLHYIQKKHSINQIKQSISHSYNIFSQTQPIFRQLRINFLYEKVKKLVNCFSIIYLILMQHIEKPSRFPLDSETSKSNQILNQNYGFYQQNILIKKTTLVEKKNTKIYVSQINQPTLKQNIGIKKPKQLGGIHLYNQQYNRHIQSDLDRLKRKLKQESKELQQTQNPKLTEKQRLKQEILRQINTDIYGSPSPDQLTLFFNLNSNRYGSELQYITFQDQLQQIAAFFKQSQDQALEFLNKSRDQFMFLNFNQGFKQALIQYKQQKQEQVNGFVGKVKILFEVIKQKTLSKQNQLNLKLLQLKKLEQTINKPFTLEVDCQTSFNFDEQINRLKKKIEEVENNYNSLKDFKKNESEIQENNLTYLQHKVAFKEHQILILKKELQQKCHFIDFLNQKINGGIDPKILRKISNLYRNHTKKNSSKLKIQLEQIQKQNKADISKAKSKIDSTFNSKEEKSNIKRQNQITQNSQESDEQDILKRKQNLNSNSAIIQFQKSPKRKRKPGISFFTSNDKKLTSFVQRNASFNVKSQKIQQANSQMQRATSEDIPMFQQVNEQLIKQEVGENTNKNDTVKVNLVKNEKRSNESRSSVQQLQRRNSKRYEPKRSAFASGLSNNKLKNKSRDSFRSSRIDSFKENDILGSSQQNLVDQEEELMKQLKKLGEKNYNQQEQEILWTNDVKYQIENTDQQLYEAQYLDSVKEKTKNEQDDGKCEEQSQDSQKVKEQNQKIKSLNGAKNSLIGNKKQIIKQNKKQIKRFDNKAKVSPSKQVHQKEQPMLEQQQKMKSSLKKTFSTQLQTGLKENANNINFDKRFKSFQLNQNQQSIFKNKISLVSQQKQNFLSKQQIINACSQKKYQNINTQSLIYQNSREFQQNQFFYNLSTYLTKNALNQLQLPQDLQNLDSQTKQKLLSDYCKFLAKKEKNRNSMLHSKLIDIRISSDLFFKKQEETLVNQEQQCCNEKQNKKQKQKNQKQVLINVTNKQFVTQINKIKFPSMDRSENLSYNSKGKNLSFGNINQIYNIKKGKLSQLQIINDPLKLRDNKIVSQNFILNLTTYHEMPTPKQVEQQEKFINNNTEQNKENGCNQTEFSRQITTGDKKVLKSFQYDRNYGVTSTSCFRDLNQISNLNQRQKVQEYLQKNAIKLALKSKNLEEFKARIKKAHLSRCGESCRHLQRYAQNFNRYKDSNRQIMRIHIQNVNESISQKESNARLNRQNTISFPTITGIGNANIQKLENTNGLSILSSGYGRNVSKNRNNLANSNFESTKWKKGGVKKE